ncbi:conserved hypothetical protein [Leishmania infantum JPCM5]|uniref:Uncharacterized protein n=2 Tax=Leishmania infantum TaxID=5671 RepID=A4I9J4_LEIIN|nr:conserved hypothetical protein [Leishmania infantum JPCM5]CAC9535925.1 hypothetical_protein_-_conserved [Leishmania infantum]CAM71497.1 conserved hypothetical protein [Leishmania infantum JPCM5]SUZ45386.1 hypothetical_protein_-_conserved [Leishmania infantum]|eukprot:XP_001468413.1 conserved hypothetical protein [Leishmania infantum JPCM5]
MDRPSRDDSTVIAGTPASSTRALSDNLLDQLQHDYPAVYEALHAYEKAVRHLKCKYKAKEAELLRCISVGEELLGQMDVLKRRCEALTHERDEAMAASASATASPREHAHTAGGAASSSTSWAEERHRLLRSHETECERYRIEVQKALQDTEAAQAQKRELELALERTTTQLSEAEKQLRTAHNAIADCEAHYAAQQEREMERHRAALEKQLAEVRQQADVDRETVLAEAMVELERLQRALVRTQKELAEQQQASSGAQALQAGLTSTAAIELASLQKQISTLAETNHDLRQRLQRREAEIQLGCAASSTGARRDDSQRSLALASDSNRGAVLYDSTLANSLVDARREPRDDAADASGLAAAQERLREENARLRQRLQEVARRGQDDVDKEHAARLSLQQQLQTMEAQSHVLRSEVVGRLQRELQQAKDQLEVLQAQGATAQRAAAELEVQTAALREEKTTLADALRAEKVTTEKLRRELKAAQERQDALAQELKGASAAAQEREQVVVQLQREKGQLFNALRTFQAQAADIEVALKTVTAEQSESTAAHEGTVSRLRDRCVLLEHEAEELKTERAALRRRLGDAEEAIDVLKDAQRVSQELVREAQRGTKTAEDRANFAADQLTLQQQSSAVHLAQAQQHLERVRTQQRDLSRRMEVCQQELSRKEEALRKSAEAQEALVAEVQRLREEQANRDESVRERWRQQYAQSNREREKLIAIKEAHVADLQRQQKELQMSLAESEDRVTQLHEQRQQLQEALSDSLATAASHKGRIRALEEELARTAAEHRAAQRELQRVAGERERSSSTTPGLRPSGECDASAVVRLAQLQGQLTECEAALCAAEQSRQRMQSAVLGCLMPVDASGEVTADADNMWDTLLDLLREGDQELCSRSTSAAPVQLRQMKAEEGNPVSDDKQASNAVSVPIDASRCAAAAVMRAIHDLVLHLHDADRRRWSCVRNKVLAACVVADATSDEAAPVGAAPPATEDPAGALSEKLCADLASALRAWALALRSAQEHLTDYVAQVAKVAHLLSKEAAQQVQLTQLTVAARTAEEQRDALQAALEEMTAKYSEAAKRADAQESRVEALRHDVAVRDTRVREMEHRLDVRQAEVQAERAEWVSKWQEAQRHREAEKKEAEVERAHLRAQVAAAEEAGHQSTQRAAQESADALQQLRAQLQTLRETSSATEVQLRQQITQLSSEKVDAARAVSRLKSVVAQLEERLSSTEATLRSREAELETAMASMQELKRVQLQRRADVAAGEAFEQRTLTEQVASLQAQLLSIQRDHDMQETLHATERAEMAALRKVNASLEARLAEVEGDRAPLREQLHSLLSFTES